METWDISPRGEKRFLEGHPWVFSNEIVSPIKKVQPGQLVQLINTKGRPLAIGYGNPHSLIAFRCLDRDLQTIDDDWIIKKLISAARFREQIQVGKYSHRMVFSEADNLPGLVIDCFKTPNGQQVFVIEILTAGMEALIPDPVKTLTRFLIQCDKEGLNYFPPLRTTFVVKRDSSFRKLENIEIKPTEIFGELKEEELSDIAITIASASNSRDYIQLSTNLSGGQKTGFFLDQRSNIQLLVNNLPRFEQRPVRALDLFCYVGQWSKQLSHHFQLNDIPFEVHAVDASQNALTFAEKNLGAGSHAQLQKMDIVEKAMELPVNHYDIVVCDPPALIKSKKDFDAGRHAYVKVNAAAMRSLKPGGIIISCSCSQHLNDQDLMDVLSRAAIKAKKDIKWIARGLQGPDHPMMLEFPQGTYLNAWIGVAKLGGG
jgi:23S rRNA (cytosine1962-C5)-methyltransferase